MRQRLSIKQILVRGQARRRRAYCGRPDWRAHVRLSRRAHGSNVLIRHHCCWRPCGVAAPAIDLCRCLRQPDLLRNGHLQFLALSQPACHGRHGDRRGTRWLARSSLVLPSCCASARRRSLVGRVRLRTHGNLKWQSCRSSSPSKCALSSPARPCSQHRRTAHISQAPSRREWTVEG